MVVLETPPPPRVWSTWLSAVTAGQSMDDESVAHTTTACVGGNVISRNYRQPYGRQPCRLNRCRGCGRRVSRPYGCAVAKQGCHPHLSGFRDETLALHTTSHPSGDTLVTLTLASRTGDNGVVYIPYILFVGNDDKPVALAVVIRTRDTFVVANDATIRATGLSPPRRMACKYDRHTCRRYEPLIRK